MNSVKSLSRNTRTEFKSLINGYNKKTWYGREDQWTGSSSVGNKQDSRAELVIIAARLKKVYCINSFRRFMDIAHYLKFLLFNYFKFYF